MVHFCMDLAAQARSSDGAYGEANRYEAYHQLIASNEPHNKNCSMGLLNLTIKWPSFKSSLRRPFLAKS